MEGSKGTAAFRCRSPDDREKENRMRPSSRLADAERILVRAPNWVGDVVMCTPALARLRKLNRKAQIVLLARPSVAPLLEGNPRFDELWSLDDRGLRGWKETIREVRGGRFDAALLLTNSFKSSALLRLAGIRAIRGFARDGRRALLAEPVDFAPEFFSVHEVLNYLRLVDDGFEGQNGAIHPLEDARPGFPRLELYLDGPDRQELNTRLSELGIDPGEPLLAITPGAAYGTAKRWHPERFAEVASRLASAHGWTILVMGSEPESETAQTVCDAVREQTAGKVSVHNLAGRWTLRLLAAVLERARLHLTNDSGPMHMAAALGTPLVAVFGSTDWITTAPWSAHARIVRVPTECAPCLLPHCPIDHRCMERVGVEAVLAAARDLLRAVGNGSERPLK